MSRIAKFGFPLVVCLVTVTLLTCGKDSPTEPTRPKTTAPAVSTVPTTPHSVTIVPDSTNTISVGQTLRLDALVKDRHGAVMSGESIAWSSSDESIAAVSPRGTVRGLGNGAVQVKARIGALTDSLGILVSVPGRPNTNETPSVDPQPSDTTAMIANADSTEVREAAQKPSDHVTRKASQSPDLVVESVEVSETNPSTGQRFSMSATVKNQGGAFSGFALTTLRFYMSTDATISADDTEIGTRPILPLDASETKEWSLPLLYAPSTAGTYYYGACVEPLEEETDKQNNCSEALTLSVGGPDLVVESVEVSEMNLSAGQRFSMSATVKNQGAGATIELTTVRFYSSQDTTISADDTEIGTRPILPLDASETKEWSLPLLYAPSTAGTYYYGACVEPLEEETDKQNNCSEALTLSVGGPDLVVESVEVSEMNLSAGQRFSMSATVKNQGAGATIELTTVRFYSSQDATISADDTEIGTRPILPLDASETKEWSLPLLYAPSTAGTYYYGACVEPLEEETDKQNNCSEALTLSVGGPDLVVESVEVSEMNLSAGQRFSMSATVKNQGAGATIELTTVRFYSSQDATISADDTEIGTRPILPLDASETKEWSLPLLYAPSTAGTYYYGACVEPLEEETDKQNNCSEALTISLKVADLVVERPTVSDVSPGAGQRFSLSATVRNQGAGDALEWATLRYYRSSDAVISASDTEVGTDFVSRLDAEESADESISLNAPSTDGTYYYGACVDPLSAEADTQNNCSDEVAVTVSGPDLYVESPTVSNESPEAAERFSLSVTIRNQGGGDAPSSTTLRYYRSSDAVISASDTEVGTDFVSRLDAEESADESISLNAPSTGGTYYYGACVEALSNETDEGNNCSLGVAVTVGQTANRPPVAHGTIPDQDVDGGESVSVDVSSYFTDPDGDPLTYRALTSNSTVATAFIPDDVVTIRGESVGNATITITASDGSLTAGHSIQVTVRSSVVPTPDLVVERPSVSNGNLDTGDSFTLNAQGSATVAPAMLRIPPRCASTDRPTR